MYAAAAATAARLLFNASTAQWLGAAGCVFALTRAALPDVSLEALSAAEAALLSDVASSVAVRWHSYRTASASWRIRSLCARQGRGGGGGGAGPETGACPCSWCPQ